MRPALTGDGWGMVSHPALGVLQVGKAGCWSPGPDGAAGGESRVSVTRPLVWWGWVGSSLPNLPAS